MNTCGCCTLAVSPTPALIFNRPGLSSVQYRIGTFASFREAMIEGIALATVDVGGVHKRPLAELTARTSADYGIAVLELWAYVADVLTFYQERTFNEALLRTAILRESVLGLCRLLDYHPSPGAAAATLFAFTLERGKNLAAPVGLRVQSVPGANEKPQKFETVETQKTDAVLNSFRIFPPPSPYAPLASGSTRVWVADSVQFTTPLVKNDQLAAFKDGGNAGVEEKRVESLETVDGRRKLEFSPAFLPGNAFVGGKLFRWSRKLRLLGSQAPDTYISSAPDATDPRILLFTQRSTPIQISLSAQELALEGIFDQLKTGQRLLFHAPERQQLVTITGVDQLSHSVGPLTATVTVLRINPAIGTSIADLRKVVLYELTEPEILFDTNEYPGAIGGNQIYLHPADAVGVEPRRLLILDDASANPRSVTVTSGGSAGGYVVLTITPGISPALDQKTAFAYGNVVQATHGETIPSEPLGNGDAAATFQTFRLAKGPVTYVRTPGAPNGVSSTLEIRVDGVLWHEQPTLFGHSSRERIFTTSRDNKDMMTVRFGDGLTGSRLTSGRANVVAKYRQGLGQAGSVAAGSLRNPLDRPVGLKSVINPIRAQGGADPETLEKARTNAPNTVRTFGRIVSLRDFEDSAREFPGVARSRAIWAWDGEQAAVHLTAAGDDGVVLSNQLLADLVADLDKRRDPNRKLTIEKHRNVPVLMSAAILVNPDFVKELVQHAVAQALADHFAFANTDLGQPVHLSAIYTTIQNVDGVVAADVNKLQFKSAADRGSHGATSALQQKHLRIFANEIPMVETASVDITVTQGLS